MENGLAKTLIIILKDSTSIACFWWVTKQTPVLTKQFAQLWKAQLKTKQLKV